MNGRRTLTWLALGLVGAATTMAVAYALWFQVLTLDANIDTGELLVRWSGTNCDDNEPPTPFDVEGFPQQTKDVGSFEFVRTDPLITITVTNAYPGYAIDCELEWRNIGEVPVHLERWLITVDDPATPENPDFLVECLSEPCESFAGGPALYDLVPDDPIYARVNDPNLGCQLHTGQGDDTSFIFGVRQPARELTTYTLRLYAQFNQWNESGWNGCDTPKATPVVPVLPLNSLGTPYDPALAGESQQP
jgi:hypothetical protein